MLHHSGLIKAQVGVATSSEKQCLTQDAEMHCDLIVDHNFWEGLKHVIGDIEPICYGTNINQKVADGMTKQIEKHWKDCNQPLFLLTVILNPFEDLSSFGENAGMNYLKCNNLLIAVCVSLIKQYTRHATNEFCRCTNDCKPSPVIKVFWMSGLQKSGLS